MRLGCSDHLKCQLLFCTYHTSTLCHAACMYGGITTEAALLPLSLVVETTVFRQIADTRLLWALYVELVRSTKVRPTSKGDRAGGREAKVTCGVPAERIMTVMMGARGSGGWNVECCVL